MHAPTETDSCNALVVAIVALLCVGGLTLGTAAVGATHEEPRTTNGFKVYTPGGEIPTPGERDLTAEMYMVPAYADHEGPIPPHVEFRVDFIKFYTAAFSNCEVQDARTGGIDRGNNDSGTHTDKSLVQNLYGHGNYTTTAESDPGMVTNTDWNRRSVVWLQFPPEDALYQPLYMHEGGVQDEGILAVEDCIDMPGNAGWYRDWVYVNGTISKIRGEDDTVTVQGETYEEGDYFEGWEPSPWYPVCDCNRTWHVAMKLDELPPGKTVRSPRGTVVYPNGSVEIPSVNVQQDGTLVYDGPEGRFTMPPENVTSEGVHFPDGFVEFQGGIIWLANGHIFPNGTIVTSDGSRIPPADQQMGGEVTPTAGGTATGTATAAPVGTPTPTAGTPVTPAAGAAAAAAGNTQTATENGPTTPSSGAGPGFGGVVAVLALLVTVLAARAST